VTQILESPLMKMIYRKLSKTASLPVTSHQSRFRLLAWDQFFRQFSARLLKPGLEPVLGPFRLESRATASRCVWGSPLECYQILMREVTPCRCAHCNPSMPVAGMTSIDVLYGYPGMATRVTAMATRVSCGVPSSACKYRHRSENKDYVKRVDSPR
jgi:hypothetical protein